jgi:uncharacterized protein (DUF2147 family)
MKNTIKVFGIIAIVAVIGFTMTACPPDDDEGPDSSTSGRLTITGLNSYNGRTIMAQPQDYSFDVTNINSMEGNNNLPINGDSVTFYVWKNNGKGLWKSYSGNDKNVTFTANAETDEVSTRGSVTVNFSNGKGSGAFVPE